MKGKWSLIHPRSLVNGPNSLLMPRIPRKHFSFMNKLVVSFLAATFIATGSIAMADTMSAASPSPAAKASAKPAMSSTATKPAAKASAKPAAKASAKPAAEASPKM